MKTYLQKFILPTIVKEELATSTPSSYPFGIFPYKKLEQINFEPITIFYGNNGSGKSTLLNIIAAKLGIARTSNFNKILLFEKYLEICKKESSLIPSNSKFIASEDVFSHILQIRLKNSEIDERREELEKLYYKEKYTPINYEDMEELGIQNEARAKSMNQFVKKRLQNNIKEFSNGETSIRYFNEAFRDGNLYLLDEPENSLAPKFQLKLAKIILDCARFYDCQFIIASHSPFILSIKDALIYDLDDNSSNNKKWYELENMKIYYEFFKKYSEKFDVNIETKRK